MDEMFMAASETSQCIKNAPFKSDSRNSPFRTRHQMSLFEFYDQHPVQGARFAQAMAGAAKRKQEKPFQNILHLKLTHYLKWTVRSLSFEMSTLGAR